jgi:prepilin-type N-terminal cleavage/methylation domain-containing protein
MEGTIMSQRFLLNRCSPCTPQSKGFTLIELLISVAVITMLAGMAAQVFRSVLISREIAMNRLEKNETARTALDFLSGEIRSAYITPDSVKPKELSSSRSSENVLPRFRFAGIRRDYIVTSDSDVPGAGKDDDGDGKIDEEVLDGVDGDFNSSDFKLFALGRTPRSSIDDEIDEDIGMFPSDILHFVSAIESSGDLILQEISYGLDPSGTRLIRRAQILDIEKGSANAITELQNFGQFVDNASSKRLLPEPVVIKQPMPRAWVTQAIQNWDEGAKYGWLQSRSYVSNKNPDKLFQVLAYDVRGLRFTYWYYDYNRGGWRTTREWDSARETALMLPTQNLFSYPAANSSIEGNSQTDFSNIIVNEPEDMYPRDPSNPLKFLVSSPNELYTKPEYSNVLERVTQRTDGLPNIVEITIYVQDPQRTSVPKPYTTRVFVPNNYRSIGQV